MPQPAKIAALPADVLQELYVRVINSGFRDYHGHSEWLRSRGHDVGHTAVWRYFRQVKEESRKQLTTLAVATQTATLSAALAREAGEDFNLATEHTIQVAAYTKLQDALAQGEISMEELLEFQHLTHKQRLTRVRAATERKRAAEAEQAPQGDALAIASPRAQAEHVGDADKVMRKAGLSAEATAAIRAAIEDAPE